MRSWRTAFMSGVVPAMSWCGRVAAKSDHCIGKNAKPLLRTVAAPARCKTAPAGMVWIPGGEFSMGSTVESESLCGLPGVTRDALPVHRVYVDGFWMAKTELTNEEFEKFVKATGYVTIAERTPTKEEFPGAPPENLVAGSTVFTPTRTEVPLDDYLQWWRYVKGANWRHPEGPQSNIKGKETYPVVQIAYDDAVAYARWAGKRLPISARTNSKRIRTVASTQVEI